MHKDHVAVIDATRPSLGSGWSELWDYRELGWMLSVRDIRVRYKQALLGIAWAVLQPLANMVVFTFLLSRIGRIASDGIPYPLYTFAGLVPWLLFANSVTQAGTSVVGAANLVQKVYFPRLLIPLSAIGTFLVDFAVSFGMLVAMMLYYRVVPGLSLLLLPVVFLGLLTAAAGVGIWLAALTVAYRDFRFVVGLMMQVWMLTTPVVFPLSAVPEQWRWVIEVNPLTGLVGAFRACLFDQPVDLLALGWSMLASALLVSLGVRYFRGVEAGFSDVV